jgi:4-amino-4-deoxy-L-arabinose transferase-like glycosyltransferase
MKFVVAYRPPGYHAWLVIILAMVFLLAGLTDHDPWKVDDAIHIGIANGFAHGGNWLIPTVAGEVRPDTEPLYHWLAATTGRLSEPLFAFHNGARLASAIFAALFLVFLASAESRQHGAEAGWSIPLLGVGTLGMLVPLHEAGPATAILAGAGLSYWGAALVGEKPATGALALGTGIGIAFMSGGLGPTLALAPLLLAPLVVGRRLAALIATITAGLACAAWPLWLADHAPDFLDAWWKAEIVSLKAREGFSLDHLQLLGWFGWPVLFIGLWSLWIGRRRLAEPGLAIPLLGALPAAVWFFSHEPRPLSALLLLPPLILLSAGAIARLRRGAASAWDWFGMMTFTIVAALIWLGYVAMQAGWPPKIAHNFAKLEPGFVANFSTPALLAALIATGWWLGTLVMLPRSPWRAATRWATGIVVMWVLLAALWMPWVDYGKTYRPVVAELRRALPADAGCIGRSHLGPAQRALLDYFAGIRTIAASDCAWMISQGGEHEATPAGWSRVWQGHRPGDRGEYLRLYRRD